MVRLRDVEAAVHAGAPGVVAVVVVVVVVAVVVVVVVAVVVVVVVVAVVVVVVVVVVAWHYLSKATCYLSNTMASFVFYGDACPIRLNYFAA